MASKLNARDRYILALLNQGCAVEVGQHFVNIIPPLTAIDLPDMFIDDTALPVIVARERLRATALHIVRGAA